MASREVLSPSRPALSLETVEALAQSRGEPEWLREMRRRAFSQFEALPTPDNRTEGWRRTSLRGLTLDAAVAADSAPQVSLPDGAIAMSLRDALADPQLAARVERHFGQVVSPDADKFVAMHYAFFNVGVVIVVLRNQARSEPLWLRYDADASQAALVHTLILLDEGAEARVVEEYRGGSTLASGVVETVLGANAHLRYVQLQRFSPHLWNFSPQRTHLGQDASVRTLNVALGSRLSRNTVQVILEGKNSQADILGVVGSRDAQHVDFETLQDHWGDGTRSDLVIHNALWDRSSTNFTGLIRINKPAHATESSQEQKNVLLSDHARADSDPKLEILNNDVVRCTHGAAVGPVDDDMVFYLESRGLDRTAAEGLIVEGFFRSVLHKADVPSVEERLWDTIAEHEGSSGDRPA
ncbi:MAG: Fe-S cluster assembly protein SufD [Chloroflexota bacterium]